jgi:hypothetical protein
MEDEERNGHRNPILLKIERSSWFCRGNGFHNLATERRSKLNITCFLKEKIRTL